VQLDRASFLYAPCRGPAATEDQILVSDDVRVGVQLLPLRIDGGSVVEQPRYRHGMHLAERHPAVTEACGKGDDDAGGIV
jgi:hypothetical protein